MDGAITTDRMNPVAINSETQPVGNVHYHNHNYFGLQQPPNQSVLHHLTSRQGMLASVAALSAEATASICGFVVGSGLAEGIKTTDHTKMVGCYSIAGIGAIGVLYAAYAGCKEISDCRSVCCEAMKLTGLGAMFASVAFFIYYSS